MAKDEQAPAAKKERFKSVKQVKAVYDLARKGDPMVPWLMLGAFLGTIAVFVLIALLANWSPGYLAFIGSLFGMLAAVFILSRRAEKIAYQQIEGMPGAAGATLQGLRRGGWSYEQQPVAVDAGRAANMSNAAMVFRAVGKPGVVLIGEGPGSRAARLLAAETKKVARLVPNVPVTTFRIGEGEGEDVIAARELVGRMQRLPSVLTKEEIAAVSKRLNALTNLKPPVPAGLDPNRVKQMGRGPRR